MEQSEHENDALMNINSANNNAASSQPEYEYRVVLVEEEGPKGCKRFMPLIFEGFVVLLILLTIIYIIYCIFVPESEQKHHSIQNIESNDLDNIGMES